MTLSNAIEKLTYGGKKIASKLAALIEKYEYVGLRTQDIPFSLGTMTHVSKVWDNGCETDDELDGISVTSVDSEACAMHSDDKESNIWLGYYYGDYLAIIAGNEAEAGEDDGEIIISDAEVIEILK